MKGALVVALCLTLAAAQLVCSDIDVLQGPSQVSFSSSAAIYAATLVVSHPDSGESVTITSNVLDTSYPCGYRYSMTLWETDTSDEFVCDMGLLVAAPSMQALSTDSTAKLLGMTDDIAAWTSGAWPSPHLGDLDRDGDLDLAVTADSVLRVYRNDGSNADPELVLVEEATVSGVSEASPAIGDFDQGVDGPELLLLGDADTSDPYLGYYAAAEVGLMPQLDGTRTDASSLLNSHGIHPTAAFYDEDGKILFGWNDGVTIATTVDGTWGMGNKQYPLSGPMKLSPSYCDEETVQVVGTSDGLFKDGAVFSGSVDGRAHCVDGGFAGSNKTTIIMYDVAASNFVLFVSGGLPNDIYAASDDVSVSAAPGHLLVMWTAPYRDAGDLPLLGYIVSFLLAADNSLHEAVAVDATETELVYPIDKSYSLTVAVQAVNAIGLSGFWPTGTAYSAESGPAEIVLNPRCEAGNGQVTVKWDLWGSAAADAATMFVVCNAVEYSADSSAGSYVCTGLTNGASADFYVGYASSTLTLACSVAPRDPGTFVNVTTSIEPWPPADLPRGDAIVYFSTGEIFWTLAVSPLVCHALAVEGNGWTPVEACADRDTSSVVAVAVSIEAQLLVTAEDDGVLRLFEWNGEDGAFAHVQALMRYASPVDSLLIAELDGDAQTIELIITADNATALYVLTDGAVWRVELGSLADYVSGDGLTAASVFCDVDDDGHKDFAVDSTVFLNDGSDSYWELAEYTTLNLDSTAGLSCAESVSGFAVVLFAPNQQFFVHGIAPAAATSLVAEASTYDCTDRTISLSWTEPDRQGGPYSRYQVLVNDEVVEDCDGITAQSCSAVVANPDAANYFTVVVDNGAGTSPATQSIDVSDMCKPDTPSGLAVESPMAVVDDMLWFTVSWEQSDDATDFMWVLTADVMNDDSVTGEVSGTNATVSVSTTDIAGASLQFEVAAVSSDGFEGDLSDGLRIDIPDKPLKPDFVSMASASQAVVVSWDQPVAADPDYLPVEYFLVAFKADDGTYDWDSAAVVDDGSGNTFEQAQLNCTKPVARVRACSALTCGDHTTASSGVFPFGVCDTVCPVDADSNLGWTALEPSDELIWWVYCLAGGWTYIAGYSSNSSGEFLPLTTDVFVAAGDNGPYDDHDYQITVKAKTALVRAAVATRYYSAFPDAYVEVDRPPFLPDQLDWVTETSVGTQNVTELTLTVGTQVDIRDGVRVVAVLPGLTSASIGELPASSSDVDVAIVANNSISTTPALLDFEVSVDGGDWTSLADATPVSTQGLHTLEARAVAPFGASSEASDVAYWVHDREPPTLSVITGPDSYTSDTSFSVVVETSEEYGTPRASYTYELDDGAEVAGSFEFGGLDVPETYIEETTDATGVRALTYFEGEAVLEISYDFGTTWTLSTDDPYCDWSDRDDSCTVDEDRFDNGWHVMHLRFSAGGTAPDQTPAVFSFSVPADVEPPVTASLELTSVAVAEDVNVTAQCLDESGCSLRAYVDGSSSNWTEVLHGVETPLPNLEVGWHLVVVCAVDIVGNEAVNCLSAAVHVIPTPSLSWTLQPPATSAVSSGVFMAAFSPPDAPWEWSFADDQLALGTDPMTEPVVYEGLAAGEHTVTLTAVCAERYTVSISATWVIDSESESSSATVSGAEGTLDDGLHRLYFSGVDFAGNVLSNQTVEWEVDTVPPTVEGVSLIGAGATDGSVYTASSFSVSANLSEAGSYFLIAVDGVEQPSSAEAELTLADGTHSIVLTPVDLAGNVGAPLEAINVTVDATAPVVTELLLDSYFNPNLTALTVSVSDAHPPCEVSVTVDGDTDVDGTYTLSVATTDSLGNTDAASATAVFVVDLTPPDTYILDADVITLSQRSVALDVNASEAGCSFWALGQELAGGVLPDLGDGVHVVEVAAMDPAGNVDPTPANVTIVVDTTAPVLSRPADLPVVMGADSYAVVDDGSICNDTTECALTFTVDGVPVADGETVEDLAEGLHTLGVAAVDGVGFNASATYEWEVDMTRPDVAIEIEVADDGETATIAFACYLEDACGTGEVLQEDEDCSFAWRLEGNDTWVSTGDNYEPSVEVRRTLPGTYEVHVVATDSAGWVSDESATWEVLGEVHLELVDHPNQWAGGSSMYFSWESDGLPTGFEYHYGLKFNGEEMATNLATNETSVTLNLADFQEESFLGAWTFLLNAEPFSAPTVEYVWSVDACLAEGEQESYEADAELVCTVCPQDAVLCIDGDVLLQEGYWRPTGGAQLATDGEANADDYNTFFACHIDGACAGGSECADGYEGVLCSECATGYGRNLDGTCSLCSFEGASTSVWAGLAVVLTLLGMLAAFLVLKSLRAETTMQAVATLKIAANYLLMMSILKDLRLDWGGMLTEFYSWMGLASGGGIADVQLVSCTIGVPIYYRYALYFSIPIFVVVVAGTAVLAGVAYCRCRGGEARLRGHHPYFLFRHAVLVLTYFAYPVCCTAAFRVLHCESVLAYSSATGAFQEKSYLVDDYHEECDGSTYRGFQAVALFYICIVAPAVPGFIAWSIYRNRSDLDLESKARRHLFFFFGDFKPEWYAWEVTVMLRKVALGGIAVLLSNREPEVQVYFGLWLLLVVFVAQVTCQPHKNALQRNMETYALAAVTTSLLLGQALSLPSTGEKTKERVRVSIIVFNTLFMLTVVMVFDREAVKQLLGRTAQALGAGQSSRHLQLSESPTAAQGLEMGSLHGRAASMSRIRLSSLFDSKSPSSRSVPDTANPLRS